MRESIEGSIPREEQLTNEEKKMLEQAGFVHPSLRNVYLEAGPEDRRKIEQEVNKIMRMSLEDQDKVRTQIGKSLKSEGRRDLSEIESIETILRLAGVKPEGYKEEK